MALKSHDILLTSVDDLIARFKAAGYKHVFRLMSEKRASEHFKRVRCAKDCQCIHCKKQILKGEYAYSRTVAFGMYDLPNNPYGYFGFKMCSENCVEEVLKWLDAGRTLGDIVVNDEKTRQILINAKILVSDTASL
jgi:hypothetical protein